MLLFISSNCRVDPRCQCPEQPVGVLFPSDYDQWCHSRVRSRPCRSEQQQKCHHVRHVPHVHLSWRIRGHSHRRFSLFKPSAHTSRFVSLTQSVHSWWLAQRCTGTAGILLPHWTGCHIGTLLQSCHGRCDCVECACWQRHGTWFQSGRSDRSNQWLSCDTWHWWVGRLLGEHGWRRLQAAQVLRNRV